MENKGNAYVKTMMINKTNKRFLAQTCSGCFKDSSNNLELLMARVTAEFSLLFRCKATDFLKLRPMSSELFVSFE